MIQNIVYQDALSIWNTPLRNPSSSNGSLQLTRRGSLLKGETPLFSEATFNDGKTAYNQFWNKYVRPPRKEYLDLILKRRGMCPYCNTDLTARLMSEVFGLLQRELISRRNIHSMVACRRWVDRGDPRVVWLHVYGFSELEAIWGVEGDVSPLIA